MTYDPDKSREALRAALEKHFPPELIAQKISELPPDAQARIRAEFAPRPTVRRFKFIIHRKKP